MIISHVRFLPPRVAFCNWEFRQWVDARSSLLLPSFRVCFVLCSFIVLRVFGTGGKLVIFGVVFFFAHTFCLFVSDVLNVPIELSLERVVRRIARRAFFFLLFSKLPASPIQRRWRLCSDLCCCSRFLCHLLDGTQSGILSFRYLFRRRWFYLSFFFYVFCARG